MTLTVLQIIERRGFIGGSDAPAIVAGGDEWRSLWLEKTGRVEPKDLSDVLPVQLGSFTEPFNLDWYERQTGREVTRRGDLARHPDVPYLAANLDGVTVTSGGLPAYIDAKHVGKAGDQLTVRYTAQGTHCAQVLGFDWWCLSTLIGNSKWELTEQEVDPFFAAEYLDKCEQFWRFVVEDKEPPETPPLPVPPPRVWRTVTIDLGMPASNWEYSIIPAVEKFSATEKAAKDNAIARKDIKSILPEDVGLCRVGLIDLTRNKDGDLKISTKRMPKDG